MANLSNINNKFLVTTGGNVLIGQTSAVGSSILQVTGASTFTGNILMGNTVTNPASGFADQTGIGLKYSTTVPTIEVSSDSSAMQLGRSSTGGEGQILGLRKAGTIIHNFDTNNVSIGTNATFAGNVGIGAAASDGNLHVRKTGVNTGITNVLMNANFADGSNGTGLSIGYRTDETTAVIAARTATGNIAFYSYNGGWSESMRIKNDGNVGIGVVTPANLLSAYNTSSTVLASLTIDGIAVNGTGGGNREFTTFTNASTTSFTGTDAVDQGYGYFDFGSGGFAANTTYTIHFKSVSVNGYLFQIVTTSSRDFFGGAVKNITKYPLPVSGELYSLTFTMDGTAAQYLGFGAVRDSGTMSLAISEVSVIQGKPDTETGSLVAYKGIVAESPAVSQYLTSTSGSQATLFIGRSIDTQAKITSGDVSANDLCFYVNNTRRLVIENGGDVGIGTDSPNNPLTVAGNLLVTTTVGDGQEDRFKVVGGGSGDDGNVYVYNDTQSATIRLNSGGASYFTNGLMVGYTSGSYKVQVLEESTNTTNIGVYTNIRGAGTNNYAFYADAANGTSTNFGFYGNSGKNAFLGDTGIGTDSPGQKLDVAGLVKHQGLDMTAGVQVDQITSYTKTLTGTANTWRPTGIDYNDIGNNGSYLVQVFNDDHSGAGPANYSWYWTGTMSWYYGGTNNATTSEIYLNGCGHHTDIVFELRTKVNYNNAANPYAELEWKSATSFVDSPNWIFKFRRLM